LSTDGGEQAPPGAAALARRAVERYPLVRPTTVGFLRHGENTTYRVEAADGAAYALRLHRPGYQTPASIRSEMAWMESLRDTGLVTPAAVAGNDGHLVQELPGADGVRLAALFEWLDGVPLSELDRIELWERLGELMAIVHAHGMGWERPAWFTRHAWDVEGLVGERPHWGDPLRLNRWSPEQEQLLVETRAAVRERLERFGSGPDRYGLVHADLSFENVLVRPDGTTVLIDFDDGGFGWYCYELAVALFPYDGDERFAARRDALVAGYRRVATLSDAVLTELPTFVMARRLATLGWTFSHAETGHARRQRAWRLQTFPDAARRFLAWDAEQEG
jgi:Ser/Thr protein kinase RdoA (MazF antagonist)